MEGAHMGSGKAADLQLCRLVIFIDGKMKRTGSVFLCVIILRYTRSVSGGLLWRRAKSVNAVLRSRRKTPRTILDSP